MASHRRVRCRPGLVRATGLVAATVAAAGLVPAVGHAEPAGTGANDPSLGGPGNGASANAGADAVKQEVAQLYQQAEADTQAYDATEERIARLQAAVANSGTHTAQLRAQLAAASGSLGRLAAAQYRTAGVNPSIALVFSTHPDSYLARAGMTDRIADVDHERVLTALRAQQALDQLNRESATDLSDLRAAQTQLAVHRADIEAKLAAARDRLDALDSADRNRVAAALAAGGGLGYGTPGAGTPGDGLGTTAKAAAPSLSSLVSAIAASAASATTSGPDASPAIPAPDVSRAITAVSAAYSELGKPYVWGATGPGEFDCSGLTQHAWAAAGVQLPRTSQEQAGIGPSVPVSAIKPGDLVIYFSGRTHVGIYVGQGMVIHAPRPGSVVQFTPLSSMPIDKVVRPEQ
ncbi:MAG TPA: C40 family peptidase [Actinocrinis sp.]|nr:C40 family peptidase [Actinocrinis sp.]